MINNPNKRRKVKVTQKYWSRRINRAKKIIFSTQEKSFGEAINLFNSNITSKMNGCDISLYIVQRVKTTRTGSSRDHEINNNRSYHNYIDQACISNNNKQLKITRKKISIFNL